jgi:hypothetical protein
MYILLFANDSMSKGAKRVGSPLETFNTIFWGVICNKKWLRIIGNTINFRAKASDSSES